MGRALHDFSQDFKQGCDCSQVHEIEVRTPLNTLPNNPALSRNLEKPPLPIRHDAVAFKYINNAVLPASSNTQTTPRACDKYG